MEMNRGFVMASASRRYVDAIRDSFQMRPVLPFGTPIALGHVVEVNRDGRLDQIGTIQDILGVEPGDTLPPSAGVANRQVTSGDDVTVGVLADGAASTLFPQFPHAHVRIELGLSRSDSLFALVAGPEIIKLENPHRLYGPILEAYAGGKWDRRYAVIVEIATPANIHVILSKADGTNVLLGAGADVSLAGQDVADLSGSFHIQTASKSVDEYRATQQAVFYNAIRVKDSVWSRSAGLETLSYDDEQPEIFEEV